MSTRHDKVFNERIFEDIVFKYPELIEDGLIFKGRQVNVKGKRVDLLFEDRHGQNLIVELKVGNITRKHTGQLMDYEGHFLSPDDPTIRTMLVGNRVPENIRRALDHHGFEWKEIPISFLKDFLGKKNDTEFLKYFPLENLATNVSNKFISNKPKEHRQDNRTNTENRHHQFFVQLLEQCNKKTKLFSTISPTNLHYVYATAGKSGLQWGLIIYKDKGSICLRLSLKDKNINWNRCKILESNKTQIEEAFGERLSKWDFREGRAEQFIYSYTEIGGLNNDENWSEIQIDMVDRLIKLEKVLRSYLNKLP